MDGIATLTDLQKKLNQDLQNNNLVLTAANSAADTLTHFLATLPTKQLNLSGTTTTLNDQAGTLVVVGNVDEDWSIRGTGNCVHIGQVTLLFTETNQRFQVQFSADGTLTIGKATIDITGTLDNKQQLSFTLKAQSALSLSLTDTANFISNTMLAPYLPLNVNIFDSVPLTTLDVSFGFSRSAITHCVFTSDINTDWSIINNFAALKKVGMTLDTQYFYQEGRGFQALIGGNIHATLNIQQDFEVLLALQGQNYWEIEVLPANGNILPGLSTLAGLVGGEALQTSVQSGLDKLGMGAISLDAVSIGFNIADRTLRNVIMCGHITIDGIIFNIQAYLPHFAFFGDLSSATPLQLRTLLGKYVADADAFPEVDITRLSVGVQPDLGHYSLYVSISSAWAMDVGAVTLGFENFDFEIVKDTSGVTGSLDARFTLANVTFNADAQHVAAGAGWQFHGYTAYGQDLPIGTFVKDLATLFTIDSTLPAPLAELTLDNIDVMFDTQTKDFTFTCEAKFPIDSQEVDIVVSIAITRDAQGTYSKNFSGQVTIGTLQFTLHFSQDSTFTAFVATYSHSTTPQSISIKDLIANVSPDVATLIPVDLQIDLKDVIFAFSKSGADATFLFGLDISVNIPSLSNLPLVGRELPADQTIKVNDLQLLVASKAIKQDSVTSLNALIGSSGTNLPGTDLSQGLNLSASMNFGGSPQILAVPVASAGTTTSPAPVPPAPSTPAGATSADNAKWFTLQKSFGPVHFNRVGVKYQDAVAWFLLDASLSLAGLTLSLDGLAFGSPLSKFDPKFDLHGLGIDYSNGPAEIGGAFLRTQGKLSDGTTYDEYDGAAVIKTEELTLSALGSYAVLHENPSLFIYAVLDYPLGGPSFFFITGLAAGFGYNRSLIVPPVDRVAQFPLVSAAVNGASPPQDVKDLTVALAQLAQYIHPEIGEIFFAIGIKFTSFKIIDSFVLLTVAFGNELEINVLGLSTMIQPPPVPGEPAVTPLAEVQMALKATFIPAQGFLGISAQLTSASYIISRSCQLTGGFAFYTWFAGVHSGDFVQTLGGYHPSFIVPDYYPRVPRLGFNWQVDGQLSIKGGAYFALTASLLMAGMQVQATWNSGNLQAWFNVAVNFIIAWKPFHYDATAHLDLGASYTFEFFGTHHLTFDVGADLHIWGPEFSGQAHINLDIISFDVSFGNSSAQQLSPINWPTFKQSFLPPDAAICGISVTNGLVSKQSQDASDLGVINPKYFALVTNSLIPSSQAHIHNDLVVSQVYYTESGTQQLLASFSASPADGKLVQTQLPGAKMKAIGPLAIGSMGVSPGQFTSKHTIVITRDGNNVEGDFAYTPILKNVPVGLWGQSLNPALNGQRFVENALSGFEIRPAVQATPGETAPIDRSKLQYDPESIPDAYSWTQDILTFQADSLDEPGRRQRISDSIVAPATVTARQQLSAALGVSTETIDLSQASANAVASTFLFAPQVEKV